MENDSSALPTGITQRDSGIELKLNEEASIVLENENCTLSDVEEESQELLICHRINRPLLYCKSFYFCYSAALGALWPYLPLYFRQLFLTPRQVGTIVASRTFVQFLCTPFWSGIAEKYNKHKLILLLAVTAWLLSTLGLLLVPAEEPKACLKMSKRDHFHDWYDDILEKGSEISESIKQQETNTDTYPVSVYNKTVSLIPKYSAYDPDKHVTDLSRIYLLLLFITILGISISGPSLVLADICTLQRLEDKPQNYGKQVLWGSVGYGLFAFIIGASVSVLHLMNPCTKKMDVNYVPCFFVFAAFMTLTFIAGSQFHYNNKHNQDNKLGFIDGLKSIHDIHLSALLIVTFYCGMGSGFISTFLFWHLREMGALQIQLAVVSLLNSIAEVFFYLLSDRVIDFVGHFRVIYLGLFCFALRFFYYSFLKNPWYVLPIELTQGMTSAGVRSALVSYVGQEPGAGTVLQGLFNGVHSGLGFSVGGLVGGLMVHEFGHSTTFLVFGEVSLVIMFSFVLVNNIWPTTRQDLEKMKYKKSISKTTTDTCHRKSDLSDPQIDQKAKMIDLEKEQIIGNFKTETTLTDKLEHLERNTN